VLLLMLYLLFLIDDGVDFEVCVVEGVLVVVDLVVDAHPVRLLWLLLLRVEMICGNDWPAKTTTP